MKFIVALVLGSLFLTGCTGDKEDSAKTADSADSAPSELSSRKGVWPAETPAKLVLRS